MACRRTLPRHCLGAGVVLCVHSLLLLTLAAPGDVTLRFPAAAEGCAGASCARRGTVRSGRGDSMGLLTGAATAGRGGVGGQEGALRLRGGEEGEEGDARVTWDPLGIDFRSPSPNPEP